MEMPSDPNANTRVRVAFLFLFVFMIVASVGAYFIADLPKLQERNAVRESQAALHDITDPTKIDEALRQHPSNKFLQMIAIATKAEEDTAAAIENMSKKDGPSAISTNYRLD